MDTPIRTLRQLKRRREAIVRKLHRLMEDVESWNDNHPNEPPIVIVTDFTADIAEIEAGIAAAEKATTR